MTRRSVVTLIAFLFFSLPSFCQQIPPLDLATRVGYQRAIEEVYWQERIWPQQNLAAKPPLGAVISVDQLQAKAEDGLRLSNALEKYWHTPIVGQQLQAEIVRMAQNSKQPEVLLQLFAALDNNPRIIAEVLARPLLAERLARSFYEHDSRFSSKTQPFDDWWSIVRTRFTADVTEPSYAYVVPVVRAPGGGVPNAESWSPTHALPEADILMAAVWTGAEMIIWGGTEVGAGKFNSGSRYNPATDTWRTTAAVGAPGGRMQHTAIWTGTEMIVWGGCEAGFSEHSCQSNSGGRYNPAANTWARTTFTGAASPRINHRAVWTGTEMIVWGGCSFVNDACRASQVGTSGGRYNPSTDSWIPTNTAGAPVARTTHTAVWTGTTMIVWGGSSDSAALNSGGVYNPATDQWSATAPVPASFARYSHTAVWTGREMIVWGGTNGTATFQNGLRYNPSRNAWRTMPVTGAPSARYGHVAIWTGTEMVVWSGINGPNFLNTGGRFNPATNLWTATSTVNAPSARGGAAAVWTGSLMVVWGGQQRTGGRYDPVSDTWTATNANEATSAREWHTAIWTGTEMIVWGGDDRFNGTVKTGGRYNLATDSWASTLLTNAPSPRHLHTAVWTGNEMIIWGGAYGSVLSTDGGRYNPVTNTWAKTKNLGAPPPRGGHSVVWTGTEMIVFGGSTNNSPWSNTGGRYNPGTDSWTLTSTVNAPTPRELAAAVWTGSEMIVWGGATATFDTSTGGRYNPATNTWTATSTTNAPPARDWTSAVWTGSKMLIWGGQTYTGVYAYHNDGGLYDPASNTWTDTSLTGAPSPRAFFGYVWTGTELIAWGGCTFNSGGACSGEVFTGGRYNPTTNSWTDTLTLGAPSARSVFHAVWTGNQMIVWGGFDDANSTYTFTGGVYTPGP